MKYNAPTMKQWQALYEVAININRLKPWEYLCDDDIIAIKLPEREGLVYCSVLGANQEMYAIIVYPDDRSFSMREHLMSMPGLPSYAYLARQNCVLCNFSDRDEVSDEDYKIIRELGLKFRGKNQWITFDSYKTGYAPWHIGADEANVVIGALRNFCMACLAYLEGKQEVDFRSGKMLFRTYNEENKLWYNYEADRPDIPFQVPKVVTVDDEVSMARLRATSKTKNQIEADVLYLPIPFQEKSDEIPAYPQICLLADRSSGFIFENHIICDGEAEEAVVLSALDRYILQYGRPRLVYIRDEIVEGLIGDFCMKCGIQIRKTAGLPAIDSCVRELTSLRL